MKHYKELNALHNKISDGRSTRQSIARAVAQYVSLFDTKDELAIELNEYKNIHFERSLPTIITDFIAQFGSNLPGDQLVLWNTYNADLPRATFEEYTKEQVKDCYRI
jgi:hypothetical protein